MKRFPSAESLEDSKMSFGEHLEELRGALWKAVVAIFLGFLVGLSVAKPFIRFVSEPLEAGLSRLEQQQKLEDYAAEEAAAAGVAEPSPDGGSGEENPADAASADEALTDKALTDKGLAPRRFEIDTQALLEVLRGLGVGVDPPEELPDSVVLPLWSEPNEQGLVVTETQAGFALFIKASLVVGMVLASPAVFYFIWNFVAAGLYPHEKRYVHVFLPISIGLFLFGATFAFYVVLQYVISFLLGFNAWLGIETMPRINEWIGFVMILPIGFGLSFQLPLVMLFLERIGVCSVELYLKYWKYAVLVIFVLSMILSPPDPWSQVFMAIPLCFLYGSGVLLCKLWPKRTEAFGERLAS